MASDGEKKCRVRTPQVVRCSQKGMLGSFFETLLEITGILFILVELCGKKSHSSSVISRR
jgi:hypothetical protein